MNRIARFSLVALDCTDRPQQAHIDFDVADLDHAEEEVLVIVGLADTAPIRARRLARNQFQTRWSLN